MGTSRSCALEAAEIYRWVRERIGRPGFGCGIMSESSGIAAGGPKPPSEPVAKPGFASKIARFQALRAFRHPNYTLFFCGQIVSVIGVWMQAVAQSWLVYRLTESPVLLGFVGFAGQIPVLIFATAGGAAADRFDRRNIIRLTQAASMILAFSLAALTLADVVQVWHVFVIASMLGVVNAFDMPARQAFVVDLVGREDIINAVGLNSSMFNGARIVGPAIAGAIVASAGEGWCFFANGVSYLPVIGALTLMKIVPRERAGQGESALARIAGGFAYVGRTSAVRSLLLMLGVASLVGMPYVVLMPIFADQILHGGPRGLGLLMTASGVGALAGALSLATKNGIRGLEKWVAYSAAGFGASLVLFSVSSSFWLSAALLVPVGFFMMVQMASSNTLIQNMVPDNLRGRVMAIYSMTFMGMAPFGALIAGAVAGRFGAPAAVAVGGAVCFACAAVFRLRLPCVVVEAEQVVVALQVVAGVPADEAAGDAHLIGPCGKPCAGSCPGEEAGGCKT